MSDPNDTPLDPADALVRRHLSDALDGQLGRAEAAFLRHLDAAPAAPTDARPHRRAPALRPFMGYGGWTLSVAGTALAACVAGLLAAPTIFRSPLIDTGPTGPTGPRDPTPGPRFVQHPTVQVIDTRTWDDGTVIFGDTVPARCIVREEVEQVQYYDPEQRARIGWTVPRRDVRLMEMDTY